MAALTEEQTLIRDQARAWVTEQSPVSKFRKMRDEDAPLSFLEEDWQAMIDMGWSGILVPERYGGSGLGYLTLGIVLEETGRQLTASPLLASAGIGATALLIAGSEEQRQRILPGIVDGSNVVTLAVDEGPRHNPRQVGLSASPDGEGLTLNGEKVMVQEGAAATHFVVATRTSGQPGDENGISLVLVDAETEGLSRTSLSTVDSRGYTNLSFAGVKVGHDGILGAVDAGYGHLEKILDRACATTAAEMMGTACQAFDMTLEYLKTRVQFGQVIGSFQALGHRAADLFTEMELTRSCMEGALSAIDADSDDVAELCSLSKTRTGEFVHHMSNELIQIHGGIGMTDEFDAGLYLKRARPLEAAWGNQSFHRDRYARLLGF
ncbi:MAG: acyl-CoA dehydrogenase family protein [Pseudomonadota bacterium]